MQYNITQDEQIDKLVSDILSKKDFTLSQICLIKSIIYKFQEEGKILITKEDVYYELLNIEELTKNSDDLPEIFKKACQSNCKSNNKSTNYLAQFIVMPKIEEHILQIKKYHTKQMH